MPTALCYTCTSPGAETGVHQCMAAEKAEPLRERQKGHPHVQTKASSSRRVGRLLLTAAGRKQRRLHGIQDCPADAMLGCVRSTGVCAEGDIALPSDSCSGPRVDVQERWRCVDHTMLLLPLVTQLAQAASAPPL